MNVVFHIGLPRVASTTLQQSIFPEIDAVNLVNYRLYTGLNKKMNVIVMKNINRFIREDLLKYGIEEIRETVLSNCKPTKINVISHEGIYNGSMWSKKDRRFERLKKLRQCFPSVKLLIGVRNQQKLILSFYKKYIECGGVLLFDEYKEQYPVESITNWKPYIDVARRLFNDVYVYSMTDIKSDLIGFVNDVSDWLGCKPPKSIENKPWNRGYSLWQLKFARLVNNLFQSECNPNGFLPMDSKWLPHRIIFQSHFFPEFFRGKEPSIEEVNNCL